MKKTLTILSLFLFCVAAALAVELYNRENPPRQLTTQAQLLVLEGDDIVRKMDLDHKFVFILMKNKIFYMDTGVGEVWYSSPKDILAPGRFGAGHLKMLLERYAA